MLFASPSPNDYINFIKHQWVTFICIHLFFSHWIHKTYVILKCKWIITFAVVVAWPEELEQTARLQTLEGNLETDFTFP